MSKPCPCCSGKTYEECCGPLIAGTRKATTAEELMRSRYTAHTEVAVDYIIATVLPEQRERHNEKTIRKWAESTEWARLDIRDTEAGGPEDETGTVSFTAYFMDKGQEQAHQEDAKFKKEDGVWYFDDAEGQQVETFRHETPKVKSNDPCPCGSGKKHKKCCGRR